MHDSQVIIWALRMHKLERVMDSHFLAEEGLMGLVLQAFDERVNTGSFASGTAEQAHHVSCECLGGPQLSFVGFFLGEGWGLGRLSGSGSG